MSCVRLSFITAENERTLPLIDGVVQPEGVELVATRSHPSETIRAFSVEQGLTAAGMAIEDLVARRALDL